MKDKEMIEICENCKIKDNCSHRILTHMEKCKVNDCDYFQNISTDKEKQIEEIAKVLSTVNRCEALALSECIKKKCEYPHYEGVTCIAEHQAETLYEQGYRKLPKDSVVLSKEEYELLTNDLDKHDYGEFESGYSQGSKETAEKSINDIFKICKQRFTDTKGYTCWGDIEIEIQQYAEQVGVEIKE